MSDTNNSCRMSYSAVTELIIGEMTFNVTEIFPDANSLFSIIAIQHFEHALVEDNLLFYVTLLRGICCVYLKSHLLNPVLRSQLLRTCQSQLPEQDEEILVAEFLGKLPETNGVRGGEECLEALSVKLLIRINVYTFDGLKRTFPVGEPAVGFLKEINLLQSEGLQFSHITSMRTTISSNVLSNASSIESSEISVQTSPEVIHYQLSEPGNGDISTAHAIGVGTWNIRGGNRSEKRDLIDSELEHNCLDLVCLQELRMSSGIIYTRHYKWYVNSHNPSRTSRGTAILVRKVLVPHIRSFSSISQNICVLTLQIGGRMLALFCFHSPSDGDRSACREYVRLSDVIRKYANRHELLILGDWNAHLGSGDRETDDLRIGPILHHSDTNENGQMMKMLVELNDLEVMTTKLDRTCKETWQRGQQRSQIDHILRQLNSPIFMHKMKGLWKETITDHKLIMCRLKFENGASSQTLPRPSQQFQSTKRRWDLNLLAREETQERYRENLDVKLGNYELTSNNTLNWQTLAKSVTSTAQEVLCPINQTRPLSPITKNMQENCKRAKFDYYQNPSDSSRNSLKLARQSLQLRIHQNELQEHSNFFSNLNDYHVSDRIKKTYSYVRLAKKASNNTSSSIIPLRHWEEQMSTPHRPVRPYLVDDFCPLLPPPTEEEVCNIVLSLKRGKAPGDDSVNAELLQHGIDEILAPLTLIIQQAWEKNDIPTDWVTSLQFPLPKVKNPKTTDDYRLISLTSTGYKVYVNLLYQRIEHYLPEIPPYQAGFIRQRSASDQLFILRRVLDERWNEGVLTYVLSLDLRRAFPSVDIDVIPIILRQRGVPTQLINRLSNAALRSRSSLVWFNQKTKYYEQQQGVKQGCPISPLLFNLVLDEVVQTLQEILIGSYRLQLETFEDTNERIRLPFLMAYADDILLVSPNLRLLEIVFKELLDLLASVNLKLNGEKTKLLVRDPSKGEHPTSFLLAGITINRTDLLKYLGSYISSMIDRPLAFKDRKICALRVFHSLLPYLQNLRAPFEMLRLVYTTVILPIILYGLNVMSLTEANRSSLARKENLIVKKLAAIANPSRTHHSVKYLLRGRTINRRVSAQRLRYHAHIMRRPAASILPRAMNLTTRFRRVGRPAFTWNESLAEDRQQYPYSSEEWELAAPDKTLVKRMTEVIFDPDLAEEYDYLEEGANFEIQHSVDDALEQI